MPRYVDRCHRLIYRALGQASVHETTRVNGEIVDSRWILHHFEFDSFRIFGFLDDFAIQTARVGDTGQRVDGLSHDVQRAFYSGYFRCHGLKAQVVYLPIGVIGSVFIETLRQNDNGVQNSPD